MIALFLALLLALVITVFALQTTDAVTVRLLFWDYHTSLVLVILGAAGLGASLAFVVSIGPLWSAQKNLACWRLP